MKTNLEYTIGSDNIFEDLDLENPEELAIKSDLMDQIEHIIKQKRLTKKAVCKLFNLKDADVSAIKNIDWFDYSLNQLICFLDLLGHEVSVVVTPKKMPTVKARKPIALPKKVTRRTPVPRPASNTVARIQARKK